MNKMEMYNLLIRINVIVEKRVAYTLNEYYLRTLI